MIAALLFSASFMILILISILILAINVKKWAAIKEQENQKKFEELTKRINETQSLFKREITEILQSFKKILNHE